MSGPAFFAYVDNYLVDVKSGIIMDVEASRGFIGGFGLTRGTNKLSRNIRSSAVRSVF